MFSNLPSYKVTRAKELYNRIASGVLRPIDTQSIILFICYTGLQRKKISTKFKADYCRKHPQLLVGLSRSWAFNWLQNSGARKLDGYESCATPHTYALPGTVGCTVQIAKRVHAQQRW